MSGFGRLYICQLCQLVQYNKTLKTFYERILENTEFKKKGIVAVMRKLLVLIYTLWKKDEEYKQKIIKAL